VRFGTPYSARSGGTGSSNGYARSGTSNSNLSAGTARAATNPSTRLEGQGNSLYAASRGTSSAVASNRAVNNIESSHFASATATRSTLGGSLSSTHSTGFGTLGGTHFAATGTVAPRLGGPLQAHGFAGSSTGFAGSRSYGSSAFSSTRAYNGNYYRGGYGGYGYRGFGYGWGGCWGYYWPACSYSYSPWWGYPGYGIYNSYPGYGVSYSDPNYSSANVDTNNDDSGAYADRGSASLDTLPIGNANMDNSGYQPGYQGSVNNNPITNNVAASTPTVLLYLKDGTTLAASDYWLTDGVLHYDVSYGGQGSVDMGELDLQRTVNENARRGIPFSLKPAPDSVNPDQTNQGNGTAPSAAPASQPVPPVTGTSQT
jgi:hypothetical protein